MRKLDQTSIKGVLKVYRSNMTLCEKKLLNNDSNNTFNKVLPKTMHLEDVAYFAS